MAERIVALTQAQVERLTTPQQSVREIGTIAALDLVVEDAGYLAGIGPRLMQYFIGRGVLLRPLGSTIYVMLPAALR